jgi:hypothetical protein
MHDINLLIMLLIISGIGFIWFLLHEARENFEKKNKDVDEYDILSEINNDDMEDSDDEDVESTEDDNIEETTIETPPTPKKKKVRKNIKKKNK